jgi:hypothetical protein
MVKIYTSIVHPATLPWYEFKKYLKAFIVKPSEYNFTS